MKLNLDELHLRVARTEDLNTLVDLRIQFLNELQSNVTQENLAILKEELKVYFKNALNEGTYICLMAEWRDKIVGLGAMVVREQPGNFLMPGCKIGYILNIYTLPEYRKNGLCQLIMNELIDKARDLGIGKVELHASKDGEPIYRKMGFVEPHGIALELWVN